MAIKFVAYLCVATFLVSVVASDSNILNSNVFHVSMDEDLKYRLDWTFDRSQKIMTFTVHVKTTGWVGFGISPYTGKMPGSDVVIGWVDNNGKAYLQDRYATGRTLPELDSSQDYKLVSGSESNGTTAIKFWRKFDTGDTKDLKLDTGTTRLIWAYNNKDPVSTSNIPMHNKMGTRSVNLFERMPEKDKPVLPSDYQTYDFRVPNVSVPNAHTTYWCVGLRMPELTEKNHIIRIDPIITKGNEGVVHHMTLYECESDPKWHGYSSDCSSRNMPLHLTRCRGGAVVAGWAVGGESSVFPAHTGLAIGQKTDPKFTVIEMHYDNPEGRSDFVDTSGFKIFYTRQLRQYDVGTLTMGHAVTPTMMIPEKQDEWNITGYCPQMCTERAIPMAGINIFGVFFHTHLAGVALYARHFRKGKELPLLAQNKHYDFNYQEVLYLRNEIKMLPGDSLAITCSYKTANRNTSTVGGEATKDEMCLNYVFYYPKLPFSVCVTYASYTDLVPYFTKLIIQGRMPNPTPNSTTSLAESVRKTVIGDSALIKELHDLETYRAPDMYCSYQNHSIIMDDLRLSKQAIPKYKIVENMPYVYCNP
ncbi:uncharacterized protein TRIADDRAFT_55461 [Trichoplax adhaerens]|uniref:DOMON domain-containing protein n=1 Tax=Trichoplax adhaerens TaxID=10228 RepID=B3RUY8_TRIAD|nr:hypothetical protein TRIADDRAFT_55461 [Trichoplax adhaerens]EDV25402.1 hypothetical protein TRIADDRAFT_55461 [Trichoplax adhaerens]|eukprot:XP_002111435.1 hypothetical protein TRIADDRAFT_55461 [Trichoplax adhaerens]